MRLRSSVIEANRLSLANRQEMFALMQQCFENIHWETFEKDLSSKWLVIQIHDPSSGKLVGFSTQVMLEARVDQTPIQALFSGDTVVCPSHWGDPALAHEWGQLALRLIDRQPSAALYWFLTSKGFRTYRFLPLFFRSYFPQVNKEHSQKSLAQNPAGGVQRSGKLEQPGGFETCSKQSDIIDALGQKVGGPRYDSVRKIIRATPHKDFVRKGVSDPEARATRDPHVRFFVNQNPGHERGDELCCLAPLSRQNFTRAAYRVINARPADLADPTLSANQEAK